MKDEARAMWDDAADVARTAASQQQQAAAQGIDNFAGALRAAARNTDDGNATATRVAQAIADGLDRVSSSLKGRDLNSLIRDVEDFARSQPLVFFGAAVATGFVAMRFLKSSSPENGGDYREVSSSMSSAMDRMQRADNPRGDTSMRERDRTTAGAYSGARSAEPTGSALADPDAMQRGVGTRPDAIRQSHATEFESNAGVMAEHDGDPARRAPPMSGSTQTAVASPRSDTARSGGAAPNVWPESNPIEKDTNPPGKEPRSGR